MEQQGERSLSLGITSSRYFWSREGLLEGEANRGKQNQEMERVRLGPDDIL